MRKILLCLVVGLLPMHFAFALGLNDISILLPLPKSASESEALLKASDAGPRGPIFSQELIKRLPFLIIGPPSPEAGVAQLRVVSIRLDPCFAEGATPLGCRRQIRFVWQPVTTYRGSYLTIDAAVHTFYEFNENEWPKVLADWKSLGQTDESQPLSVHPVIATEGLNGPRWQALRRLLLTHCGDSNIVRVTSMSVNRLGTAWVFTGFDVLADKEISRIPVPRVGSGGQTFFADLGEPKEFFADIRPEPLNAEPWLTFVRHSVGARNGGLSNEELLAVSREALEFEDPRKFNPGNLDCVSCHIAQTVRMWGEANFPQWDPRLANSRFRSIWNLQNTSADPFNTNRVRAFGYFIDEPSISQRVINETAVVAESLRE